MSDTRRVFASGAAAAIERWAMPEMEGPVIGRVRVQDERKAAAAAAAAAEAIARIARQESEARGYEEGLARGQAEINARVAELDNRIQQLDSVLQLLGRPLQELDAEVEKTLLQLTLTVGKQLARRELRVDPTQVIAIIRETLAQLPSAARDIKVHLHPADAAVVRERLAAPTNERAWAIVEDPTLSRGGCIVRTETSQVDARLESRIATVISNALGEERTPERVASENESPDATAPTGEVRS